MRRNDLTGKIFGRLKALNFEYVKNKNTYWKCQCQCGRTIIASYANLIKGITQSCGCLSSELLIKRNLKHGKTGTRLYRIWLNMKTRCNNPKTIEFKNYGGRGIKVCQEWQDFEQFYVWAIENKYNDKLTLDRINNNGNYEPNNCRWATPKQQARNMQTNRVIEFKGKKYCFIELVEKLNLTRSALWYRLNKNWSEEKIINTPLRRRDGNR